MGLTTSCGADRLPERNIGRPSTRSCRHQQDHGKVIGEAEGHHVKALKGAIADAQQKMSGKDA